MRPRDILAGIKAKVIGYSVEHTSRNRKERRKLETEERRGRRGPARMNPRNCSKCRCLIQELIEKLDREITELKKALEVSPMQNVIQETLNELYQVWAKYGPHDKHTMVKLNDLMVLYNEWLD